MVPVGITVADGHPVVVGEDGTAFVVDGERPTAIGKLGISGRSVALGGWRGAGRTLVAVDRATGRFAALDPRTGHGFAVTLGVKAGRAELDSPVVLGSFAYVPDYSGPSLWRVNLSKGTADADHSTCRASRGRSSSR